MAAVRHFECAKFWYFVMWQFLNQNLQRHTKFHWNRMILGWVIAKKNIFKMTAVRHLEFSKFGILVTWPVSELILPIHTKFRVNRRYSQKTIFNMAAVRHIGFVVTSSHCIWEHYFTFLTLFQIFKSIGLALSDILGLSCFIILAWNFWGQNLTFWG